MVLADVTPPVSTGERPSLHVDSVPVVEGVSECNPDETGVQIPCRVAGPRVDQDRSDTGQEVEDRLPVAVRTAALSSVPLLADVEDERDPVPCAIGDLVCPSWSAQALRAAIDHRQDSEVRVSDGPSD